MPAKKRVLYFDVLNITACIAVIALHHSELVHTYSEDPEWLFALGINALCIWAVPTFLMLSGATLLRYRERYSTRTFFQKRLHRVVIPFFLWSVLVLIWKLQIGLLETETISLRYITNTLLNYEMEAVYWYFPLQISIYLIMPLLSWLTEPKHRSTLWYAAIAMFVLQSTVPPIASLLDIEWNSYWGLPLTSSLIYVFLGYLFTVTDFSPRARHLIYLLGIAAIPFRYAAIAFLSSTAETKSDLFFNTSYFPSVLLAAAIFVWAKSVNWERILHALHITPQQVASISSCSLGIYFIHKIVMHYELEIWHYFGQLSSSPLWMTLWIPITYLVSLAIVLLLKEIPVLRKLVP